MTLPAVVPLAVSAVIEDIEHAPESGGGATRFTVAIHFGDVVVMRRTYDDHHSRALTDPAYAGDAAEALENLTEAFSKRLRDLLAETI